MDTPVLIEEDTCDEYYDCIDACAESYAESVDFCMDNFKRDKAGQEGCMALADHTYEVCLEACGERPDGC